MPSVGGVPPDAHRLGGKHAVGKSYDEDAAGLQNAVHLPEYLNGIGQVLDRHRNDHGVKGVVVIGKYRVLVDVPDNVVIQIGIVLHLQGVHSQAGEPCFGVVGRPVGTPAAHQVQHHRVRGYETAEDVAYGGNGPVVNVHHHSGLDVEVAVVAFVLAPEVLGWKGWKLGKGRTRGGPPWQGRSRVSQSWAPAGWSIPVNAGIVPLLHRPIFRSLWQVQGGANSRLITDFHSS